MLSNMLMFVYVENCYLCMPVIRNEEDRELVIIKLGVRVQSPMPLAVGHDIGKVGATIKREADIFCDLRFVKVGSDRNQVQPPIRPMDGPVKTHCRHVID